jgi:hypothetical protein
VSELFASEGMESMGDVLLAHAIEKLRIARTSPSVPCKICGGEAHAFDILDFNKSCESFYPLGLSGIPVLYRICSECEFIGTDFFDEFTGEQWQRYIYNDEYRTVDPEYEFIRPRHNARMIDSFLTPWKDNILGLDYGGGNGATTGLLRARGWAFDCFDPFACTDVSPGRMGRYNFCSAIEVFEHTTDPIGSLRAIVEKASTERLIVLISTCLNDGLVPNETRLAWWYAAPRNGHVSLYSSKSLQILGAGFGLNYTNVGNGPVLLTRGYGESEVRKLLVRGKLRRRLRSTLHLWKGGLA